MSWPKRLSPRRTLDRRIYGQISNAIVVPSSGLVIALTYSIDFIEYSLLRSADLFLAAHDRQPAAVHADQ